MAFTQSSSHVGRGEKILEEHGRFFQRVVGRLFGVKRLSMIVCWELFVLWWIRELLGELGFWVLWVYDGEVCERCLCELWMLFNVDVIYIVDSEYFCWRWF